MMKNDEPDTNCDFCPRLVDYRLALRKRAPDGFNSPVPPFGPLGASVAIIGLAPGARGANHTGRVFTGDHAGVFLFDALKQVGWAKGNYQARADDGFSLVKCRIINSLRCVPPANKPEKHELDNCRFFLKKALSMMPNLQIILALGRIAHEAILRVKGLKLSAYPFSHGGCHWLPDGGLYLFDSYHCSLYNTATRRINRAMFDKVLNQIEEKLGWQ